jgi:hypothetical protein
MIRQRTTSGAPEAHTSTHEDVDVGAPFDGRSVLATMRGNGFPRVGQESQGQLLTPPLLAKLPSPAAQNTKEPTSAAPPGATSGA